MSGNTRRSKDQTDEPAQGGPISGWRDWMAVVVMTSNGPLLGMIFVVVVPILIGVAANFGGGDVGMLTAQRAAFAFPGYGLAAGGLVAGVITEMLGIRLALIAGLVLYGVLGTAGGFIDDATVLLASRFLLGASAALVATAATMLVSIRFDEAARARVLGIQNAVGSIGSLVAIYLSAFVARQSGGWREPFAIYLIALIPAVLTLISIPSTPRQRQVKAPSGSGAGQQLVMQLLPLAGVYAIITCVSACTYIGSSQVPFILKAEDLATPLTSANVGAISSVAFAIGAIFYGIIRPRLGAEKVLAIGLAFMGAGAAIVGLMHGLYESYAGVLVLGIGGGIQTPNLINILIDRSHEKARDRAIGLFFTAQFLGTPLNTEGMHELADLISVRGAVTAVAAALILGALVAVMRRPEPVPS